MAWRKKPGEVKDEKQQKKPGKEIETKKKDEMGEKKEEDVRFHVLQCNVPKLFYMLITVLVFIICVTLANNSLCLGFHWMKM